MCTFLFTPIFQLLINRSRCLISLDCYVMLVININTQYCYRISPFERLEIIIFPILKLGELFLLNIYLYKPSNRRSKNGPILIRGKPVSGCWTERSWWPTPIVLMRYADFYVLHSKLQAIASQGALTEAFILII